MRSRAVWLGLAVISVVIGIALMGCATGPSASATPSQADMLREAGFKIHTAQDAHLAYIHTLPAKKVVENRYQNKPLYLVCTDPDSKTCFIGDRAAYDRYQQLATQQSIAEDQRQVQEQRWDPEALEMWADSQGGG
jgi:hypothetical protein